MIHETATHLQAGSPTIAQIYTKLPAHDVERAKAVYAEKLASSPSESITTT